MVINNLPRLGSYKLSWLVGTSRDDFPFRLSAVVPKQYVRMLLPSSCFLPA